ncbi:hypothetical protein BJ508DRAFT_326601 [Ascobolus immersus RN42]|uniref:F-box domain-containing protein n=1 Tax=Ascobolus immersus RN42 TaxID=1160509 RepID=A0A3N4I6Y1_ASCIM|nr:hypothetical protein BJ508DRAFT_326601 [Ascobolus immersus RN42]
MSSKDILLAILLTVSLVGSRPYSSSSNRVKENNRRQTSILLKLPVEIRLEVYTNCSTFTLLQLSHASAFLYHEINSYSSIIQKTQGYGFRSYRGTPTSDLKGCKNRASQPKDSKLNINLVGELNQEENLELVLFQNLYVNYENPKQKDCKLRRIACKVCQKIFRFDKVLQFENIFLWPPSTICYRCYGYEESYEEDIVENKCWELDLDSEACCCDRCLEEYIRIVEEKERKKE